MNFNCQEIFPNCFILNFKTQYELSSTFMRVQEFYESPFKNIKNKLFSHIQFMDTYANEYGNFTYTSDWAGFNVPGNVFNRWKLIFRDDYSKNRFN